MRIFCHVAWTQNFKFPFLTKLMSKSKLEKYCWDLLHELMSINSELIFIWEWFHQIHVQGAPLSGCINPRPSLGQGNNHPPYNYHINYVCFLFLCSWRVQVNYHEMMNLMMMKTPCQDLCTWASPWWEATPGATSDTTWSNKINNESTSNH